MSGPELLRWLGVVVLVGIGLPLVGVGVLGLGTGLGQAALCAGLALLVCAAGAIAREVVERRVRRDPPRARLVEQDNEPSLYLPRDPGPTRVSTWALTGLALIALLGAVFAGVAQQVGGAAALVVVGLALAVSSGVLGGRARDEGLWLTPTRLVHQDRGFTVTVGWDDITGVVPQQPMPVLLRPGISPAVTRTGPGRAWKPVRKDGTLLVDTAHLAGGASVTAYVVGRAITDPRTRAILGTPESLPPQTPA